MMTCKDNVDAQRYELIAKRCLKLVMCVSPSDDHVKALMHCLDEFKNKLNGLTLESSSTNVKHNIVIDD